MSERYDGNRSILAQFMLNSDPRLDANTFECLLCGECNIANRRDHRCIESFKQEDWNTRLEAAMSRFAQSPEAQALYRAQSEAYDQEEQASA